MGRPILSRLLHGSMRRRGVHSCGGAAVIAAPLYLRVILWLERAREKLVVVIRKRFVL